MKLTKIYEKGKLLIDIELKSEATVPGYNNVYGKLYKVVPVEGAEFPNLEMLEDYVQKLAERKPEYPWDFRKRLVKVDGAQRELWVVTQKSTFKDEKGKVKRRTNYVPLFFDIERKAVYVPESFLKKRQRLRRFLIFKALGTLGLVKSQFYKYVGRVR